MSDKHKLTIFEFVGAVVEQLERDGVVNAADKVYDLYGIRVNIPKGEEEKK